MYLWLELSIAFDASLREKGHVFEASVQFFVWFLVQQPHKKSPCINEAYSHSNSVRMYECVWAFVCLLREARKNI